MGKTYGDGRNQKKVGGDHPIKVRDANNNAYGIDG